VTNFFTNLGEAKNFINSILQLKGESAVVAAGRFTYNTTLGLGGFFDVADNFGLPEHPEDFGQTLGYWGADSGPFLMLPLLGPSTIRDFGGLTVDLAVTPSAWDYIESPENYYLRGLQVVDRRGDLIPAENFLSGDRYTFVRNAYLQRRQFLVNDGEVTSDPFASDDEGVLLDDF
jgi:phospholipid-binding lipoprotein MlaA